MWGEEGQNRLKEALGHLGQGQKIEVLGATQSPGLHHPHLPQAPPCSR